MERPTCIREMRVSVETIGEAVLERDVRVAARDIQEVLADGDLRVDEPFALHYEVTRSRDTLHVSVDLTGEVHTTCARCLAPMVHCVDLHIASDFVPAPPDMAGDLEAQRTSADTGYYRRDIHLGGYICSELVLSLPYIYVCSESCKGMCPRCGANLNEGPCGCVETVDPRLEVLGRLRTTR